jgi:hypothetical protein
MAHDPDRGSYPVAVGPRAVEKVQRAPEKQSHQAEHDAGGFVTA